MAANLHKGLALDDKFTKAELKLQAALQALEGLHDDFRDYEHRPVGSQVHRLSYAKDRLTELVADFTKLNKK